MKDILFVTMQYLLPQHWLSRAIGFFAETQISWIRDPLIRWFVKRYEVDMSIAANPHLEHYATFNDFFTRELADGERPIDAQNEGIACPADGCISQIGSIQHGRIFQAKGQDYSLLELLGGDNALAEHFQEGKFATIYLSPKDYHRVHMPLAGTLERMIHIPGALFSVNETTAEQVPRLFARNERVVAIFSTESGPMAIILVGAMVVASIETVWAGVITPHKRTIKTIYYQKHEEITLEKGDEIGRFKLGSTAIVLFGKEVIEWEAALNAQSAVQMGERIGTLQNI